MRARNPIPAAAKRPWLVAAALWGFAEATLFFVVVDVLLSFAVLRRGWRTAIAAAGVAAVMATFGGALLYAWGRRSVAGAEAMLDLMPAIAPSMIGAVRDDMAGAWALSLFTGAVSGVPYKIYAVEAGAADRNLAAFLLVSVAARFARFAGAILLTELSRRVLAAFGHEHRATALLALFWICFYAAYFWIMPN
jgi:membrane protein YqaA with SNARE-associated domain